MRNDPYCPGSLWGMWFSWCGRLSIYIIRSCLCRGFFLSAVRIGHRTLLKPHQSDAITSSRVFRGGLVVLRWFVGLANQAGARQTLRDADDPQCNHSHDVQRRCGHNLSHHSGDGIHVKPQISRAGKRMAHGHRQCANPAGLMILKKYFENGGSPVRLLKGAIAANAVLRLIFLILGSCRRTPKSREWYTIYWLSLLRYGNILGTYFKIRVFRHTPCLI